MSIVAKQDALTRLTTERDALLAALDLACDVALWMSGSSSFGPNGEARTGWLKQREKLYDALKVLRETLGAHEALSGRDDERAQ